MNCYCAGCGSDDVCTCPDPIPLYDWPHALRFALLANLPRECGWNYVAAGITVTLPRDHFSMRAIERTMQRFGLSERRRWFFPVCEPSTTDAYRHDASYPGSRGFTLTAHFA